MRADAVLALQVVLILVGGWGLVEARPAPPHALAGGVVLSPGEDVASDYVNDWRLGADGRALEASVLAAPHARVELSLFRIESHAPAQRVVVLRASALPAGPVARYELRVANETLALGRAATVTQLSLAPGDVVDARARVELASDAPEEGWPVTVTFTVHALN